MPTAQQLAARAWGGMPLRTGAGSTGYQGGRQVRYLPGGGFVEMPRTGAGGGGPHQALQFAQQQIGRAGAMAGQPTMPLAPAVSPQAAAVPPPAQPIPFGPIQSPSALLGLLSPPEAMPYGAGAWNILGGFSGGQQQAAQPTQITTGISEPAAIPAPVAGRRPGLPAWLDSRAVQSNLAQYLQPMQTEAMGRYYANTAGLTDAFQQARAGAGLGWAAMIPQMRQLQTARQANLLNFLTGLG